MARSQVRDSGVLSTGLRTRIQEFEAAALRTANEAANTATQASRARFTSRLSGRPFVGARPARPTTQGTFATHITWHPAPDGSRVRIDIPAMEAAYRGRKVWPPATYGACVRPLAWSPSGICISSTNQRKPGGTYSPNGNRWRLP